MAAYLDASLKWLDRKTRRVVQRIAPSSGAEGVATGGGSNWVAD